jgi:REP element-mobilizing transposase RayT
MGSTYYSLHYHWVCSTKERRPFIQPDWRPRLHEYLGGTIRGLVGMPLKIGGVVDHVHALIGLKPTHCLSDLVRELKKASSVWAATHHERQFEWQEGYSVRGYLLHSTYHCRLCLIPCRQATGRIRTPPG